MAVTKAGIKPTQKKSKNILLIIIIILLILIVIGGSAFGGFYLASGKSITGLKVSNILENVSTKPLEEVTISVGESLIKLRDEGTHYVKATISVSYDKNSNFDKDYEQISPIIKDSINICLMSKTTNDFSSKNIETIKKELVTVINKKLIKEQIINVYFTGLQVQ